MGLKHTNIFLAHVPGEKKKAPQSLKSERAQDRFMQDQPRMIYLNFPHGKISCSSFSCHGVRLNVLRKTAN